MAGLYEIAQEFKARLLRSERAAAGELLRAYSLAVRRIEGRVRELTAQIDAAGRQGEIISSGWLHERDRLTNLKREIIAEMQRFAQVASLRVAAEQRAARELGQESAQTLIGEATGAPVAVRLGALDRSAVGAIAGFAADGSPLRELFAERGLTVARAVAEELVAGVAEGAPLRVISSRIRTVMGGELARALTVTRTEVLRSYRQATLETYEASAGVVIKWRWAATLTTRTCAMCWAMDGREFDVKTPMHTHPNCRCVMLPVTRNAAPPRTGAERFADLEPGAQREILGPAQYEAFRKGELNLNDLVGVRHSERWGVSRYEKPLSAILS